MDRETLESILNKLKGQDIVIQYYSDYVKNITHTFLEDYSFGGGMYKSRISDRYIDHRDVTLHCTNKVEYIIEYFNDIEHVLLKDYAKKRAFVFEIMYRDGSLIRVYTEENYAISF